MLSSQILLWVNKKKHFKLDLFMKNCRINDILMYVYMYIYTNINQVGIPGIISESASSSIHYQFGMGNLTASQAN